MPYGAGAWRRKQAIINGFRVALTRVAEDIIEVNAAGRKARYIESPGKGGRATRFLTRASEAKN
jgi:hypothetical protein